MAEVIGVVASVLGIASAAVGATTALITLLDKIKDAPRTVNDLHSQLQTLKTVLDEIDEVFPAKEEKGGPAITPTKRALNDCTRVLEEVSAILEPLRQGLQATDGGKVQASWSRFRTVTMEDEITGSVRRLETFKSTLVIALVLAVARPAKDTSTKIRFQLRRQNSTFIPIDEHEPEPKLPRQDSFAGGLARGASRGKALLAKARASLHSDPAPQDPPPPYRDPEPKTTFSAILTHTLEKMITADDKNSENNHENDIVQALLHADLDRMQSVWKPDASTVESLKRVINDYACDVFAKSLKTPHYQQHGVKNAAPHTCEWLWEDTEYQDWLHSQEPQLLHLSGKPGSGKSVLTKTLLQRISHEAQEPTSETTEVLYFFCNNRKRPEESSLNIMRAFIYQFLKKNSSEFRRIMKSCPSLASWDSSYADTFEFDSDMLWEVFCSVLQSPSKSRFYCVIDAMDECGGDSAQDFLSRLPELFKSSRSAVLKFYISSRPVPAIRTELSEISPSPRTITLTPSTTQADINRVVETGLRKIQKNLNLEDTEKEELKEQLVRRSDGMFLWAFLALQEIGNILGLTAERLNETVERLPSGLHDLYECILNDLAKKLTGDEEGSRGLSDCRESDLSLAWRIIQWIVRAARPLTLKELRAAIALELGDTCFQDTKKRMFRNIESVVRSIPFLELVGPDDRPDDFSPFPTSDDTTIENPHRPMTPSCTVRLIHQSAKEYLLAYADQLGDKADKKGLQLPKFDDANIAGLCVTFLKFRDFEKGAVRECEGAPFSEFFQAHIESFDLLEYASSFWAYHLRRVEPDPELVSLVCSFACDSHNNIRSWCQVANFVIFGGHTDFVDDYFGLHVVAAEGIDSIVRYLIKRGDDLDKKDAYGRTAYYMACVRGLPETARLLKDAGADTDLELPGILGLSLTGLQLAAHNGDHEELARLLNDGDEVDEVDSYGRTALFYACASGDLESITPLLDADASLVTKDRSGRIPLDLALTLESRQMIIGRMKAQGIKCEPHHLTKSKCAHCTSNMAGERMCDCCGRVIWIFFYHCCSCSPDDDSFDACQECWDNGKKCLDDGHQSQRRVMVDGLESWLEYTPHLADMKFSSYSDSERKMRKKRERARRIWTVFVVMLRAMHRQARKLVSA